MSIHIGFFQDLKKAETIGCKTPLELNEEVWILPEAKKSLAALDLAGKWCGNWDSLE